MYGVYRAFRMSRDEIGRVRISLYYCVRTQLLTNLKVPAPHHCEVLKTLYSVLTTYASVKRPRGIRAVYDVNTLYVL